MATLAPPRCAACDARVRALAVFCRACGSTAERAVPEVGSTAAFLYGGAVSRAIMRMKYENRPDLARPLADLLWLALEPRAEELKDATVVPVPLHPSRLVERGFNQAALVAGRLARRLGAAFVPRALARTRETSKQATLDRVARAANVANAFVTREPRWVQGRAILLVDDVRTTGATLDACERALVDAGAKSVAHAVVATAPS